MPNSIRTTSNNQATTNSTLATFKAGDSVLCPSIGNGSYTLYPNGSDKDSTRLIIRSGDDSHGFYRDGRVFPNDTLPSLFHDTEANRQAIAATLYSGNQSSQRKIIDTTSADDNEVVILSTAKLSSIAFDIEHAAETLDDIGQTLALIHYGKVERFTGESLARLAHSSASTWAEILEERLEYINKALAMTAYAKEVAK